MNITRTIKLLGLALNAAWIAACGGAQTPPPTTGGSCGAKTATADGGSKGSCGAKGACGEKAPAEKGACGGHGGGGM